jgi:hypothetical protein
LESVQICVTELERMQENVAKERFQDSLTGTQINFDRLREKAQARFMRSVGMVPAVLAAIAAAPAASAPGGLAEGAAVTGGRPSNEQLQLIARESMEIVAAEKELQISDWLAERLFAQILACLGCRGCVGDAKSSINPSTMKSVSWRQSASIVPGKLGSFSCGSEGS